MSAADEAAPPQHETNNGVVSREPAAQDTTGQTKATKRTQSKARVGSKKAGQQSSDEGKTMVADPQYATLAPPASQQCQQLVNSQTRGGTTQDSNQMATENLVSRCPIDSPTPPQSPTPLCAEVAQKDDGNIIEMNDTQNGRTQAIRHAIKVVGEYTGEQVCVCNAERGASPISLKSLIAAELQCDPNRCTLLDEDGHSFSDTVGPDTKMIYAVIAPKRNDDPVARSRSPARGANQTSINRWKLTETGQGKGNRDAQDQNSDRALDTHPSDSNFMMCDYENQPPEPAQQLHDNNSSINGEGTDNTCNLLVKKEAEADDGQHADDHALSQTTRQHIDPHERRDDKEERAIRIIVEPAGHFRQRIKPGALDRPPESGRNTGKLTQPSGTAGTTPARPKRQSSQPPGCDGEAKRGKTQQSLTNEQGIHGLDPQHADGVSKGIVLVLLFAGGLHDLHAFLNLVRNQGHPGSIKAIYTAEHNAEVSMATVRWWNEHGSYLGAPPVEQVASNVWELVKNPSIIAQRLKQYDSDTLVLVGGSPCQDLSNVNKQHMHKRAGPQSVNVFARPFITSVARQVYKANVQAYFEHVACADRESKDIMCATLCIQAKYCIEVNASKTSFHTRKKDSSCQVQ